jgi:uncharacterized protein (TIGR02996 family)
MPRGSGRAKAAGTPTAEPRELTAFYLALEENPGDTVTLRALADWLEEHDEPTQAACLRWLAAEGKAPYRYNPADGLMYYHHDWQEGWWWWTTSKEKEPWGYLMACVLPDALWQEMRHTFDYRPCVFKEYPTVRSAIEAVLEVWTPPAAKSRPKREV